MAGSKMNWARTRSKAIVTAREREPELRVLASSGCWCGKTNNHDWAGKADGAPHPRE